MGGKILMKNILALMSIIIGLFLIILSNFESIWEFLTKEFPSILTPEQIVSIVGVLLIVVGIVVYFTDN